MFANGKVKPAPYNISYLQNSIAGENPWTTIKIDNDLLNW
jgi:hypothetical protein